MDVIQNGINGELVTSKSDKKVSVFNPATGEVSAELPLSSVEEVNDAVAAAKDALPAW
ncbi:MAG: aldehyde dehydrogenase family protein, partial [Rhizobiales bacterium]|nr:aldehyde dehydrogenase family protein [Hyphomicrobiales bacterium]